MPADPDSVLRRIESVNNALRGEVELAQRRAAIYEARYRYENARRRALYRALVRVQNAKSLEEAKREAETGRQLCELYREEEK